MVTAKKSIFNFLEQYEQAPAHLFLLRKALFHTVLCQY